MFETVIIVIAVVIAALLTYAATRPDNFHVERSIDIEAPREKVFGYINDFHRWDAWTPYDKDPAMKKTFIGNAGEGAAYAWEGNREVGKGEIAVVESAPPARIALDLHMIKPFEGHNHIVFALDAAGNSTRVSWIMEGTQAYLVKLMGLFFNMDRMVGRDFETGLARLKSVAEK